jgi:hypothetical protein
VLPSANQHQIQRLRFTAPVSDRLALRRRIEGALTEDNLAPRGLSSSAILCVRRLRLDWRTATSRNGARDALSNLIARAERPARGFVSADAEAVYFEDRAELLACLALSWMRGDAPNQWWWRSLFPGHSLSEALHDAWTRETQSVPAALETLDRAGEGAAFLRALPKELLVMLAAGVAKVFALPQLHEAIQRAIAQRQSVVTAAVISRPQNARAITEPTDFETFASVIRLPEPWRPWVEKEPNLSAEAETLFVLCKMLVQAPAVTRSTKFMAAVEEFGAACESIANRGRFDHVQRAVEAPIPIVTQPLLRSDSLAVTAPVETHISGHPSVAAPFVPAHTASNPTPVNITPASPLPPGSTVSQAIPAPPAELSEFKCSSEWAGLFYLINVALALGLYGDFTQPRRKGLALSVWDFLALIGWRVISQEFERDPLWSLLATLSGRGPEDAPGMWFEPPDDFTGTDQDAGAVWESLEGGDNSTSFERWLSRLLTVIEWRLQRAGLPFALGSLLQQRGTMAVTRERVTVHFCIAEHPIELRLSGLDRDPGWVPAAGRIISFHYD